MGYGFFPHAVQPRIFVSYHHGGDRPYYDAFGRVFCDTYDVIEDNSVDRLIDSDDADYVIRKIREDFITGTSCTVVLCCAETPNRKFVDWEIKATLDKQHALIGINLPTNPPNADGSFQVPLRYFDNYKTGYALWTHWNEVIKDLTHFTWLLQQARQREAWRIINSRELKTRNS